MDVSLQKEQFSIAYIEALAAVAGVKIDRYFVDDDSIDALLSRAAAAVASPLSTAEVLGGH